MQDYYVEAAKQELLCRDYDVEAAMQERAFPGMETSFTMAVLPYADIHDDSVLREEGER